jgi:hypothetical protein
MNFARQGPSAGNYVVEPGRYFLFGCSRANLNGLRLQHRLRLRPNRLCKSPGHALRKIVWPQNHRVDSHALVAALCRCFEGIQISVNHGTMPCSTGPSPLQVVLSGIRPQLAASTRAPADFGQNVRMKL